MKTKQHPDRKLTLREFARIYYFSEKQLANSTVKSFRHSLNRWERLTDDPPIEDIDNLVVISFTKACDDLRPASINQHRQNVKILLYWAVEMQILDTAPKIRKLKLPRPEPIAPEAEEISLLYDNVKVAIWPVIPNCSTAQWWRAWIVASYFTAARLGDVKNSLLWSNVERHWLTFTAQKTGIKHHIPLHPILSSHLKKLRGRSVREDRIFYISPKMAVDHLIRRELVRISQSAGIDVVTPKQFRNASVTEWSVAHRDAGRLIHGTGVGDMRDHYAVQRRIIGSALKSFIIPDACRSAGRNAEETAIKRARKRRIKVHTPEFTIPVKPNPNEWLFDHISFTFRSQRFLMGGKLLALLKALSLDPDPVLVAPLAKAVMGDVAKISDPYILRRTHIEIAKLRAKLRRAFGLEHSWNPIPNLEIGNGGIYTIHLPVTVNSNGRASG